MPTNFPKDHCAQSNSFFLQAEADNEPLAIAAVIVPSHAEEEIEWEWSRTRNSLYSTAAEFLELVKQVCVCVCVGGVGRTHICKHMYILPMSPWLHFYNSALISLVVLSSHLAKSGGGTLSLTRQAHA